MRRALRPAGVREILRQTRLTRLCAHSLSASYTAWRVPRRGAAGLERDPRAEVGGAVPSGVCIGTIAG